MKPEDKKELIDVVGNALEAVVLPRLQKIDDNIEEIKGTLKKHDEKFIEIDNRFDDIDERFEKIDERFDSLDDQIDSLDRKFDSVRGQADNQDIVLENHEKRIGKLEIKAAVK